MVKLLHRVSSLFRALSPVKYAYPALDIMLPAKRQLHLVGSIHMGTRDMMPLPAALLQRLNRADALIVEADITGGASPFAHSETHAPLEQRLSVQNMPTLLRLCDELAINAEMIASLPGWQVALMLQAQQAQRLGLRPDYGIDYQLLQAAKQRELKIIELEGPDEQLELLKALPDNGMPLLEDTLQHWHTNARMLQTMVSWWLEAPPGQRQVELPSTFSSELNDVLMHQRNQRWSDALLSMPPGRYIVAVGALHLYGDGNLPDLLKGR
ncbi:TraB/GumN family protein [Erwiniaceae bacterium BAC15a-03b]|uniref:TraB/GumN family protein n=1 Tax=Winslowiella arboricola TaxID=2978220 RepID=A0A9J6PGY7_9GAMM|nr:TraB/GumN family protein [Winslowiella arboricola]MCU5771959.1 TraB/GumN family protein [Winslowiella arboricola]MCU5775958.1 TraB/GumN family protein [Winslowiella arboricola]